ncbi:MAG TPA: hypothetical protein VLB05_04965 [Dongiaceae bacterium]|nr:hypothetical protein [Dongiaceae bacterium]
MPIQLDADGAGALRQDAIGTGGLAATLAARLVRRHQAIHLQAVHDVADGLGRELRRAREIGAREGSVDSQRIEDHAPVMRAGAVQVGAGNGADRAPCGRLPGR